MKINIKINIFFFVSIVILFFLPFNFVNAKNKDENKLMEALVTKQFETAKTLILNGADVNQADNEGHYPIHFAFDDMDTMQLLLDRGANVNVQDSEGNTVLHHVFQYRKLYALQVFLEKNADISIKNKQGNTAIDEALNHIDQENYILRLLGISGIHISVTDDYIGHKDKKHHITLECFSNEQQCSLLKQKMSRYVNKKHTILEYK